MSKGKLVLRALIFATIGLALQVGVMLLIGFRGGPAEYDWNISAALGLYIGSALTSFLAADWLLNPKISQSGSIAFGCLVAWISLVIE